MSENTRGTSTIEAAVGTFWKSGKEALQRGDIDAALREFERAVLAFPEMGLAHAALGSALLAVKRFRESVPVLSKAVTLIPDDASLHRQLGIALYETGDYEGSSASFRRALQINPYDTNDLFNLAETCSMRGQFAEALSYIEQIIVLTSENSGALRAYALLNQKLNKPDHAGSALMRLETVSKSGAVQAPQTQPVLGMINVEITTYCNLSCSGCLRTVKTSEGTWQKRHMSYETFKWIIETLPPTGWLGVYGIGEPTLHPDLAEMVRFARSARKFNSVAITTNAMARMPEYYSQLFDAGLSALTISVDTLDPALIDQLRPGTDVERLKERIRALIEAFSGKVDICSVISRMNIGSVPDLLKELNSIGKLTVNMQPFDDLGNPKGCLSLEERAWFTHRLHEIAKPYGNLKVNAAPHFIPSGSICNKPWQSPYITVDGHVTPCCRIVDPGLKSLGNISSSSFSEIWNAPETEKWRRDFIVRSPSVCDGCPMHVSRKDPSGSVK
ncbi:MAG: tetratricopeptide repeat protein [Nitrospirae bacterium]|nr:tetratricopeptide repeat protein [Nitrospirota bacterium]